MFTAYGRVTEPYLSVGFDSARASTSITEDALQAAAPGLSGLKMLEGVPGVVMSNSDALGLYEFGNQLQVRAFGFQQLGFSLDGIPMGRSAAFGGSPIYRYVDNENLVRIEVNQGGADVTIPSYTALGASIRYYTDRPKDQFGGQLVTTVGGNNYIRGFLRVDTGPIVNGLTSYVSYSKIRSDMWRGPNEIDREHFAGKILYEPNDRISLRFTAVYNDFNDGDYRFQADSQVATYGRYFDYADYTPVAPGLTMATDEVSYDFDAAYAAWQVDPLRTDLGSSTFFVAEPDGIPDNIQERMLARDEEGNPTGAIVAISPDENGMTVTDEYRGHINARSDALFGLSGSFALSEALSLEATVYYEDKSGDGVSYDDYDGEIDHYIRQTSLGYERDAPRGVLWGLTSLEGERQGATAAINWSPNDMHQLNAGLWYEQDDFHRNTSRYNIRDGLPQPQPDFESLVLARRDLTQTTDTTQFWVQDTITLMEERLKIVAGVKALAVDVELDGYRHEQDYDRWGYRYPGFDGAHIDADWDEGFLPSIGATYTINRTYQVFASYSESMASPTAEAEEVLALGDPRNFMAPDAPTAENFDLGFRVNTQVFSTSLALYYTDFGNKLENVGYFDQEQNEIIDRWETVGSVESYGLEAAVTYFPEFLTDDLVLTASLLINESTYQDATVHEEGNDVEGMPDWSGTLSLTYTPTSFLAINVTANHMGERPRDAANTTYADAYTTLSAYVELQGAAFGERLEPFSVRINGTNLTDEDAFGNIFSTGGRVIQDRFIQVSLLADF